MVDSDPSSDQSNEAVAAAALDEHDVHQSFDGTPIRTDASILAVIPHFRCERWLPDCLDSLVNQTRPLQGIVVINDGPDDPPLDIVKQFPQVTLLVSEENFGPYRLVQQVINDTKYDAYMFQDADDWSTEDRLDLLLEEAGRSDAEYVGSQVIRVFSGDYEAVPTIYPLDVNAALVAHPTRNPLLHPTSLVSRDLVMRVGGFATALRFSGDVEFLRRAAHVGRAVNSPHFCYFYRSRAQSLTSSPDTGMQSAARKQRQEVLFRRAELNARRVTQGKAPLLKPIDVAAPITLQHIIGPALTSASVVEETSLRRGVVTG